MRLVIQLIRWFLGLVFVVYGVVKLAGGQFYYGDWSMTRATVNGPSFVWAFYGYSPWYGRFIGLAELIPALLLFHRRTALAGAAMLFPVVLNITVMDFAYGFPAVKYMALGYTVLCGFLLWVDRARLRAIIPPVSETVSARALWRELPGAVRRGVTAAGIVLVLFAMNLVLVATTGDAVATARAEVARGNPAPRSLALGRASYTGLYGINRRANIRFADSLSGKPLSVDLVRRSGFSAWRVVAIDTMPPASR